MDYLALFGSPLSHSLSPQIHQAFAKQLEISLRYECHETAPGQLLAALYNFRKKGGIGANVTLPLKMEAFTLCDAHFAGAINAKAVNTLSWDEKGLLWGDNTDGEGLIQDLTVNKRISFENKKVLLLGAGGAAQGILSSLAPLCSHIAVVNRTIDRATALSDLYPQVQAYTYETLNHVTQPFDIVMNATSSSLQQTIPPLSPHWIKSTISVDLAYHLHQDTSFMAWSKSHGAKAAYDGLGMLIEQAALAFKRWYQVKPHTSPLLQQFGRPSP